MRCAIGVLALAGIAGCGGTDAITQDELATKLRDQSGMSAGMADCVSGQIFAAFTGDERERVVRAAGPDKLTAAQREKINVIATMCGAGEIAPQTTTAPTTTP